MELYLHLPFCRSKCAYCDFASWAGQEALMPAYAEALIQEAEHEAALLSERTVDTVFLGGGTPSVFPPELLCSMLRRVLSLFPLAKDAEFTSEANPGTLTEAWLEAAVSCGVNRISLGMQAFQPELLRMLGRIHTFEQVEQSVRLVRSAGIANLNLDLMFGLPGQTRAQWLETLEAALSLHPQHLSCYGLIPEEGTRLAAQLEHGELTLPDEDEERAMYDDCLRLLKAHGFAQYEISNFALPGKACRHNLGYWRQVPYLGLGASAASMLSGQGDVFCLRSTNPRTISEYLEMVRSEAWSRRETEPVSRTEARFETLMLGLRTTTGVAEADFAALHGVSLEACYGEKLRSLEKRRLLEHADGRWFLTRRGMDIQNSILVELMDN